jgi:hypothetical protein
MDGRRISLTPGATLRFGSLGFVYIVLVESVAGRTFARLPRPNTMSGATGREAFIQGFSDETIIDMLGPNPTQERFMLAAYYPPTLPSSLAGTSHWLGGSSWSGTPQCNPMDSPASLTTR